MAPNKLETKPCVVCGRTITWRKKWARDWEQVKYCSKACRSQRDADKHAQLDQRLLTMLHERSPKTLCPSEAARWCFGENWREQMETIRQSARRLVAKGQAQILQQGRVVDPSTAKGAIRVRYLADKK